MSLASDDTVSKCDDGMDIDNQSEFSKNNDQNPDSLKPMSLVSQTNAHNTQKTDASNESQLTTVNTKQT